MRIENAYSLACIVWLVGCAQPTGVVEEPLDPTPAEAAEIQRAFDAAACYCEAYLGGRVAAYPEDPRLQQFRLDRGFSSDCAPTMWEGVSTHGSLPTGRLGGTGTGARATNGCVPSTDPTGTRPSFPQGGFCRADFNYCLASELRLQADSFARAPSSRVVRLALLAESRSRFSASAVETAATLTLLDDACALPTPPVSAQRDCARVSATGYETVVTARMTDAVAQLSDVVYVEAQGYMAASDATALGGERGGDLTMALYGDDSARAQAGRTVMGPSPTLGAIRTGPNAIPARWRESHHAQEALRLIVAYLAPTTLQSCTETLTSPGVPARRYPLQPTVENLSAEVGFDYALSVYNYLDRRIAAAQYLQPQFGAVPLGERYRTQSTVTIAELSALGSSAESLDPTLSPLRTGHGLRPEHIREALELAADLARTMDVEITTQPVSYRSLGGFGSDECQLLAIRQMADGVRSPAREHLSSALARPLPTESTVVEPLLGALGSLLARPDDFVSFSGGDPALRFARRNWYSPRADFVARRGATGSLQILRHHLLRLRDRVGSFADRASIVEVMGLVDAAIGTRWTEHTRDSYIGCFTTPFGCLGTFPVESTQFLWSFYSLPGDPGGFDDGEMVAVDNLDDLHCLLRGHREYAAPTSEWCPGFDPTVLVERPEGSGMPGQVASTDDYHGYRRLTFIRPDFVARGTIYSPPPLFLPNELYVLWRRSSSDYELIDVIHRLSTAEVHAFGGAFGDLFDDLSARSGMNPAAAAVTSVGMPFDLIPPLENSLIDDSDAFEDSWDHYLTQATLGASHATELLAAARQHEIEILQDDRATAAEFDLAAQAESEVLSEECGLGTADEGRDCFGPRVPDVSLVDLGFVTPPTGAEPLVDPRAGTVAELSSGIGYHTPSYDGGYAEAFARTFPDEEVRGVSCDEFIENIVSLTNVPEPRECADEGILTALNTIFGSSSATAAFCRAADGDAGAAFLGFACSLPFPGFGGFCSSEFLKGYRDILGRYLTGYMHDALVCIDRVFRARMATVHFEGLPERVVSTVRGGEDAVYADTGGNARLQLIEMHQQLDRLRQNIANFQAARDRAFDRLEFARTYGEFSASTGTEEAQCISGNILQNIGNMWGGIQGAVSNGNYAGLLTSTGGVMENSASSRRDCAAGDVAAFAVGRSALTDVFVTTQLMHETIAGAHQLVGVLAAGDARLDTIERRVALAEARRGITERLAATGTVADPSWRALQGLEARRGRDAMRRATQQLFVARRAIEFRLATDMRAMTAPEPYVSAPSSWVSELAADTGPRACSRRTRGGATRRDGSPRRRSRRRAR